MRGISTHTKKVLESIFKAVTAKKRALFCLEGVPTAALRLTKLQLRNLYKFLSLRLLLPFFFSYIELDFLYVTVFVRKKTAQKQKFV